MGRHAAEASPQERKEGFCHQNQVRSYCSTRQTPSRAVGTFDHRPRGSAFHDGPPLGGNVRSSLWRNDGWRNVWSSVWWRNDGRRNVQSSVWRNDGRRFRRNEPWADEKSLVDAFMI